MGFLDRLFGRKDEEAPQPAIEQRQLRPQGGQLSDEQAIQRYHYMLRTAPPETIEQAHEEAFVKLTPGQRAMVLRELAATLPAHERAAVASDQHDPKTLARMATRAEMRQPGTLERTFGGMGGGMMGGGMTGGMLGGSFLSSLAGAFVGSMIAQQFFDGFGADAGLGVSDPGVAEGEAGTEAGMGEPLDAQGSDIGGFGDDFDAGGDFGSDFGGTEL